MSNKTTQSRNWLVTVPAFDERNPASHQYDETRLRESLEGAEGFVYQLEQGEDSGYLHYQLFVAYKSPRRFATIKSKFPGCHIEAARSKRAAIKYCQKVESRLCDPVVHNLDSGESQKEMRARIVDDLRAGVSLADCIRDNPDYTSWHNLRQYAEVMESDHAKRQGLRTMTVVYIYGAKGTGKSMYLYDRHPDAYRTTPGPNLWDKYTGESVVIVDEYMPSQLDSEAGSRQWNSYLDQYPLTLPARYYDRTAQYEEVYLTSNFAPNELTDSHVRLETFLRRMTGGIYEMTADYRLVDRTDYWFARYGIEARHRTSCLSDLGSPRFG